MRRSYLRSEKRQRLFARRVRGKDAPLAIELGIRPVAAKLARGGPLEAPPLAPSELLLLLVVNVCCFDTDADKSVVSLRERVGVLGGVEGRRSRVDVTSQWRREAPVVARVKGIVVRLG
jgi:hypothetical protein